MPPNGEMCKLINYVCQPMIEHPVFVSHCWTVYNITVLVNHNRSRTFWHSSVLSNSMVYSAATINWYTTIIDHLNVNCSRLLSIALKRQTNKQNPNYLIIDNDRKCNNHVGVVGLLACKVTGLLYLVLTFKQNVLKVQQK